MLTFRLPLVQYYCLFLYLLSLFCTSVFADDYDKNTTDILTELHYGDETSLHDLSIDDMLIKADNIRSSNNPLANKLLSKVSLSINQLSKNQTDYLNYLRAYQLSFQAKYDDAELILQELINSNASRLIKFRSHYTLVNIYSVRQKWQLGLKQLAKVVLLAPQITSSEHKKTGLLITAIFYNHIGQYQLAIDAVRNFNMQQMNSRNKCIIRQQILLAKLRLAIEERANPYQKSDLKKQLNKELPEGIDSCEEANEALLSNVIRTYQAELYLETKQAEQVIKTLLPHNKAILATNYPILITLNDNLLAQAYWLKKDIVNTKKYALLAKENSQLLAKTKQTVTTYQLLYRLAEQEKDYPSAFEYHKKYSQAKQSVLDETQAKHLAFQLASYNNFANETEIEQLNQKNKLLNTQHQLSEQQQENSLLLIMLLLTFLAVFSLWSYRSWLTQQRLKLLTEYDGLTKAYSRGHFIELAKEAVRHCKQAEQPLTCVLFDLDHLKKINDQYGHATGDKVLIKVVEVCQSVGRQHDVFGRLAGEEFAFILPGCGMIIAEDIANKCREKIADIDHESLGINRPITASFGVSDVVISGFDFTSLLADADSAMYSSKEHGRNCVNTYR